MVTATNEFVTRPIADLFGIEALVAVELARDETGWITGEIEGVPTMREGKVTRMGDSQLGLEVANGVEIQIQRSAVIQVLPKGSIK